MTAVIRETAAPPATTARYQFVWCVLTDKCQLSCVHCYANSGPDKDHGIMSLDDWRRVIDQIAGIGAKDIQFVGGEVTLYPHLVELIDHALGAGLQVEVFTNLVHVTPAQWTAFSRPGVRLAASYYSDDASEHARITGRDTLRQTEANIAEAGKLGIPLRIGGVDILERQRVEGAKKRLLELGFNRDFPVDVMRGVGRGGKMLDIIDLNPAELCGQCTSNVLAIFPDGAIAPCVFTRGVATGNVQTESLESIVGGLGMTRTVDWLDRSFAGRKVDPMTACSPNGVPSCIPAYGGRCGPR